MPLYSKSGSVIAQNLELMDTPLKRARGLLKFAEKPASYAAVFELPFFGFFPLIHTVGMRFAIDILFCDRDQKLKHRYLNVKPGRMIMPITNALGGCPFMIELSGCDSGSLELGEKLSWGGS